jgi:hypothetical protein
MITMRPGYETLDHRSPGLEYASRQARVAAEIDARIAVTHPHLRTALEADQPGNRELRQLRRRIGYGDTGSMTGRRDTRGRGTSTRPSPPPRTAQFEGLILEG